MFDDREHGRSILQLQEDQEDEHLCREHGKPLVLLCNNRYCQTLICTDCLVEKHTTRPDQPRRHNIIKLQQKADEIIRGKLSQIKRNITTNRKLLVEGGYAL